MTGKYKIILTWFIISIVRQAEVQAISPPYNLQILNIGSDTVTIGWTAPEEGADWFEAKISPLDEGESAAPQFFNNSYVIWGNLVPGKAYTVEIKSFIGGSEPSYPAIIKFTTVPSTPYNVKISKFVNPIMNQFRVTGRKTLMYPVYGAVVSWEQPEFGTFDDFVLTVDPPHGTVRVPIKLKSGITTQQPTEKRRVVWDLLPGVLYSFSVQSKSNGVVSETVTGGERMPPEVPGEITVEKTAPTYVIISWEDEHRGILDGYIVETNPDGGVAVQLTDDPEHKRRRVENLTPGTKYQMEVYSTMNGLLSHKPRTVDLYTPPATPIGDVISEDIRTESVLISWKAPPGKVDYYEVVYYPSDRDFGRLRERVWETKVNLTILDPGSAYAVEVFAVSNDIESIPLNGDAYTRPLPPNNVITTSTHDTIQMSWETVYYDGGSKIVYYPVGKESTDSVTQYLEPGMTEITVTNLQPGTNYIVEVYIVKNGVDSNPVTLETKTTPTITKAPPSDNVPVQPETAAYEAPDNTTTSASTTTTTSTTSAKTTAALSTTTSTKAIEESATPEDSKKATTTSAKPTKESKSTQRTKSDSTTQAVAATSATTTSTDHASTTTSTADVETTTKQLVQTTSQSTEANVRTEEETTEATTTSTAAKQNTEEQTTDKSTTTHSTKQPTQQSTLIEEPVESTTYKNPEKPVEPTTQATEPTARETEPTTRATEPTTRATEPTTRATEPTAWATEPTARTIKSTTPATEPTARATEPTARAIEPSTHATEPSTRATDPTTRLPESPTTQPEKSNTEPAKATTRAGLAITSSETTRQSNNETVRPTDAANTRPASKSPGNVTTQEPHKYIEETTPFVPFPLFPDEVDIPGFLGDSNPTPKTKDGDNATTQVTTNKFKTPILKKSVQNDKKEDGFGQIFKGKSLQSARISETIKGRITVPPSVVPIAKFDALNDAAPVAKAGEIYLPKYRGFELNTVGMGSTLSPHFSLPNIILGKTVKPFPTTKYYPFRYTTDPWNTPTPKTLSPITPYTIPPTPFTWPPIRPIITPTSSTLAPTPLTTTKKAIPIPRSTTIPTTTKRWSTLKPVTAYSKTSVVTHRTTEVTAPTTTKQSTIGWTDRRTTRVVTFKTRPFTFKTTTVKPSTTSPRTFHTSRPLPDRLTKYVTFKTTAQKSTVPDFQTTQSIFKLTSTKPNTSPAYRRTTSLPISKPTFWQTTSLTGVPTKSWQTTTKPISRLTTTRSSSTTSGVTPEPTPRPTFWQTTSLTGVPTKSWQTTTKPISRLTTTSSVTSEPTPKPTFWQTTSLTGIPTKSWQTTTTPKSRVSTTRSSTAIPLSTISIHTTSLPTQPPIGKQTASSTEISELRVTTDSYVAMNTSSATNIPPDSSTNSTTTKDQNKFSNGTQPSEIDNKNDTDNNGKGGGELNQTTSASSTTSKTTYEMPEAKSVDITVDPDMETTNQSTGHASTTSSTSIETTFEMPGGKGIEMTVKPKTVSTKRTPDVTDGPGIRMVVITANPEILSTDKPTVSSSIASETTPEKPEGKGIEVTAKPKTPATTNPTTSYTTTAYPPRETTDLMDTTLEMTDSTAFDDESTTQDGVIVWVNFTTAETDDFEQSTEDVDITTTPNYTETMNATIHSSLPFTSSTVVVTSSNSENTTSNVTSPLRPTSTVEMFVTATGESATTSMTYLTTQATPNEASTTEATTNTTNVVMTTDRNINGTSGYMVSTTSDEDNYRTLSQSTSADSYITTAKAVHNVTHYPNNATSQTNYVPNTSGSNSNASASGTISELTSTVAYTTTTTEMPYSNQTSSMTNSATIEVEPVSKSTTITSGISDVSSAISVTQTYEDNTSASTVTFPTTKIDLAVTTTPDESSTDITPSQTSTLVNSTTNLDVDSRQTSTYNTTTIEAIATTNHSTTTTEWQITNEDAATNTMHPYDITTYEEVTTIVEETTIPATQDMYTTAIDASTIQSTTKMIPETTTPHNITLSPPENITMELDTSTKPHVILDTTSESLGSEISSTTGMRANVTESVNTTELDGVNTQPYMTSSTLSSTTSAGTIQDPTTLDWNANMTTSESNDTFYTTSKGSLSTSNSNANNSSFTDVSETTSASITSLGNTSSSEGVTFPYIRASTPATIENVSSYVNTSQSTSVPMTTTITYNITSTAMIPNTENATRSRQIQFATSENYQKIVETTTKQLEPWELVRSGFSQPNNVLTENATTTTESSSVTAPTEPITSSPQTTTSGRKEITTSNSNVTQTITQSTKAEEDITVIHNNKTVTIRDGFKTICEPNNITVLVDKEVIGKYESLYGPLHLNEDNAEEGCRGVEYGRYYRYTIAPNILGCGSQFEVNGTHVNFTNTVSNRRLHAAWYKGMLDPSGTILVGRSDHKPFPLVHMNIYCTFPLDITVHTNYTFITDIAIDVMTFNVTGKGQFAAAMQLYKDEEYRYPHFGPPSLQPDEMLRVGVTLLKTKDESISIAVRKCWATPVPDYDYDQFYPLIDEYCPIAKALEGNLTMLENGMSKRSRWEGPVFRFVTFKEVWLHCELKVCFDGSCANACDDKEALRARRALPGGSRSAAIVSAGPIFMKSNKPKAPTSPTKPTEANTALEETTVIIIVAVLCTVILISCIIFIVIILKCCRKRSAGKGSASSTTSETAPVFNESMMPVRARQVVAGSVIETTTSSHQVDELQWEVEESYNQISSPGTRRNTEPEIAFPPPPPPFVEPVDDENHPDSYRAIEDGCSEPRDYGDRNQGYANHAFDKSENNR